MWSDFNCENWDGCAGKAQTCKDSHSWRIPWCKRYVDLSGHTCPCYHHEYQYQLLFFHFVHGCAYLFVASEPRLSSKFWNPYLVIAAMQANRRGGGGGRGGGSYSRDGRNMRHSPEYAPYQGGGRDRDRGRSPRYSPYRGHPRDRSHSPQYASYRRWKSGECVRTLTRKYFP